MLRNCPTYPVNCSTMALFLLSCHNWSGNIQRLPGDIFHNQVLAIAIVRDFNDTGDRNGCILPNKANGF